MIYLIIIFVIGFMISPIFWIMPSPRQKRQVKIREKAMAMGFQIKITPLPQTHRESVRKVEEVTGVVYRLAWLDGRPLREPFNYLLVRKETELEVSGNQRINDLLNNALANLPSSITALEYSNYGLAIYWREQGGLDALQLIHEKLLVIKETFEQYHQELMIVE